MWLCTSKVVDLVEMFSCSIGRSTTTCESTAFPFFLLVDPASKVFVAKSFHMAPELEGSSFTIIGLVVYSPESREEETMATGSIASPKTTIDPLQPERVHRHGFYH